VKLPFAFHSREESRGRAAFTLLELVVTIAIIGILATLLLPQVGSLRERADKVVCMGHLRSLHVSLGCYLNDNEQWPQCPDTLEGAAAEQFWFDALADYGAPQGVWLCPTLLRRMGSEFTAPASDVPKMHYTPTPFDDNPATPRKWAGMPWLIEISDVHHGGSLIIRADGSIQSVDEAWAAANSGS